MNDIIDFYQKWNFTDNERKQLKLLTQRVKCFKKLQQTQIKNRVKLEELLEKLQKRCKHNANTLTRKRYRDFGSDTITTYCGLCEKELSSRSVDD